MSQENVEVVREAVDALNAGSRKRLFGVFHPEVEFRPVAEQKVYRGVAGLAEYGQGVDATLDDFHTERIGFWTPTGDAWSISIAWLRAASEAVPP